MPLPRFAGLSSRISLMYAAVYLHYGAFGLFIPMWFQHRGLAPEQIGALMSLPMLLRIFFVAPVTGLADRLRRIREVLLACVIGAMVLMCSMSFAHAYWQLLVFFTVFSLVWDPLPILADSYATLSVRTHGLDFGRMRLWGSIGFVVANIGAGALIGKYSPEVIPWLTSALLAIPIVPIMLLPPDRTLGSPEKPESKEWRKVVTDRRLMGVMTATALIGASHSLLNTFGAIQLTGMGISGATIGVLVGVSIFAEIAVLFVAQKLLGKHSPLWLIVIGGAVAIVRWISMSGRPNLYELGALQLLNGITGMGVITGLMLYIAQRVDPKLMSTAQGINAVVLGVIAAGATAGSGYAWHAMGANSYYLAALIAALGAVLTLPALRAKA
ncbi:MAG: MFS transporter [Terricaulis sp.]